MSTPKNDLNTTLTPSDKASASTPAGMPQHAIDEIMDALLHNMRVLATDENRLKEIGMRLV